MGGRVPRIAARATGVVAILCAALGLLSNAQSLACAWAGEFADLVRQEGLVYFYSAFYAMSAVSVAYSAVLLWCGGQLVRLRRAAAPVFVVLAVSEVLYALGLGALGWRHPSAGPSIAAATGVANGGLGAQFVILLPLWGPRSPCGHGGASPRRHRPPNVALEPAGAASKEFGRARG